MITAGVDLGLKYVKVVILKDWKRVGHSIAPTGHDPDLTSRFVLDKALEMASLKLEDIDYIVSTGYGRRVTSLANETTSEISANARAAKWLGPDQGVRTIIDIGGQDTTVIALDDDLLVNDFAMNDRNDSGIGQFLEELANVLDVPLERMGELSLRSNDPVHISSTSLVYVKSEVSNLLFKGHKKEDIIAGIYRLVARRLAIMVKRVGIRGTVLFDGGPAMNTGMIKAMEKELGMDLFVPKLPQMVTATGATLIAADRYMKKANNSKHKVT